MKSKDGSRQVHVDNRFATGHDFANHGSQRLVRQVGSQFRAGIERTIYMKACGWIVPVIDLRLIVPCELPRRIAVNRVLKLPGPFRGLVWHQQPVSVKY